ncbi:hypothetical protein EVAR_54576_1 [Eumeta japonica]|uniref:PDZ domain-containing protein n=1 Tax=Eumeta variegata TaxID=151549 RepID=A0A4C1YFX5_EUMVA|nr:hypothetical protein EVAR_54576_1 [Eumeta japonica]
MAVDVRLERTEKTPWGFRLIGGADCDVPLTIAKFCPTHALGFGSGLTLDFKGSKKNKERDQRVLIPISLLNPLSILLLQPGYVHDFNPSLMVDFDYIPPLRFCFRLDSQLRSWFGLSILMPVPFANFATSYGYYLDTPSPCAGVEPTPLARSATADRTNRQWRHWKPDPAASTRPFHPQVRPSSLAEGAGLRDGDELVQVDGAPASSMTHDAAYDRITRAGDALLLRVARGHPTKVPASEFQPIPMQDFVPLSQPYEVPNDRSRTASPFAIPAKPYRPFSTEPIPDIPPLEDPIILNPDYHDEFVSVDDDDYLPETKFKLPISEQYVPDGKKKKKNVSKKNLDTTSQHLTTTVETVEYMERMRREIDINEIEETAFHVVGESVDKALIVTEEIKKEFDNAMQEVTESNSVINETSTIEELNVEESKFTSELKTSNVKKEVIDIEASHKADEITNYTVNESNTFVKKYEQTNIAKENEIKQSQNVSKETNIQNDLSRESVDVIENAIKKSEFKEKNNVNDTLQELHKAELKSEEFTQVSINISKDINSSKSKTNNNHDNKFKALSSQNNQKTQTGKTISKNISTSNLLAEQRAYTLGLQTIPNIRGHVHSSYHYDLLLKTFFIHLTDVMVALSRFILAEPLTNQKYETSSGEQEIKITNDIVNQETITVNTKDQIMENYDVQEGTSKYETELIEMETEKDLKRKKKLSGSEMAQMSARKPAELTEKMEAVISEFQEKSQIETVQRLEVSRDRRSRSRSVIEEEVAKESDPLEWLEKHNQKEKIQSNMEVNSKDTSETTINLLKTQEINSIAFKKIDENKTLNKENLTSKHDPNKIIYVATVEAHVYTNPDVIIEDMVDISEENIIQSVESAEMNNVIESKLTACEAEVSQEVLTKKHESAINKEESYQSVEEIMAESENIQNYESVTAITDALVQEEAVEEVKEEAIVEIKQEYKEKSMEFHIASDMTAQEDVNVENVQSINIEEELVETSEEATEETTERTTEETAESSQELVSTVEQILEIEKTSEIQTEETLLAIEEREAIETTEIQESTFTAKLSSLKAETTESRRKLSLHIENIDSQQNFETQMLVKSDENDSTPIPSSVPPTPLTDEYIFRLEIPLPKSRSTTPAPREVTPPQEEDGHEDPNIVKKKLIPHIEVTIESIVYDKPLDSPTSPAGESTIKNSFEMQTSDGAAEEEDLLEIERKSSLLASAIDDTIKSIEMYKEEVGIQNISKESIATETKERKKVEFKEVIKTEIESTSEESSALRMTEATTEERIPNVNDNSLESKSILSVDVENAIKDICENTFLEVDSQAKLESTETRLAAALNESQSVVSANNDVTASTIACMDVKNANTLTESSEECYQNSETVEEKAVRESLRYESETTSGSSRVLEAGKESSIYSGTEVQMAARLEGEVTGEQVSVNDDVTSSGTTRELLGTTRGIVDGIISEALIDEEVANLGKPGMTEDEIAELISGESEMLREAHVMGLQRVLASHMNRKDDDSSVDFKKIKPTIDSLKDSEVLKALNEDLTKTKAERKAEERKWTTFLQRPRRPVPKARFGYYRNVSYDEDKPEKRGTEGRGAVFIEDFCKHAVMYGILKLLKMESSDSDSGKRQTAKSERRGSCRKTEGETSRVGRRCLGNDTRFRNPIAIDAPPAPSAAVGNCQRYVTRLRASLCSPTAAIATSFYHRYSILGNLQGENSQTAQAEGSAGLQAPDSALSAPRANSFNFFFLKTLNTLPSALGPALNSILPNSKAKPPPLLILDTLIYDILIDMIMIKNKNNIRSLRDFETGPLPWEERAAKEPPPPPVPREDPILVPEEVPQYLEAVDPLPESEVPDLEDTELKPLQLHKAGRKRSLSALGKKAVTICPREERGHYLPYRRKRSLSALGIPLPPEKEPEISETEQEIETAEENREETPAAGLEENEEELDLEEETVEESEETVEEMEQTKLADQILKNIQSMVDPSAPLDQQLAQMRAQLAALTALPGVIQHTLELVTDRLSALTAQVLLFRPS